MSEIVKAQRLNLLLQYVKVHQGASLRFPIPSKYATGLTTYPCFFLTELRNSSWPGESQSISPDTKALPRK